MITKLKNLLKEVTSSLNNINDNQKEIWDDDEYDDRTDNES